MNNNFNSRERESLDKLIKERLGQGSLVGAMQVEEEKKEKVKEGRLLQWADEWKKYPYLYIFLGVSALFTMTLGMVMGLAPKLNATDSAVIFHTDGFHLFLAFVYMVAFVSITEIAFGIGKWLYHTRENGNKTQENTTLAMMIIAGISIVGTGIAGGVVVASNIAFLSAFVEIPDAAQKWVIVIIPVLLAVYAFLLTAYSLSSASAKSERMLYQQKRTSELDHQTRQRSIMQIAEEELQVAELGIYLNLVKEGKLTIVARPNQDEYETIGLIGKGMPDMSAFEDREIRILKEQIEQICGNSASHISEKSHGPIWEMTQMDAPMPIMAEIAYRLIRVKDEDKAYAASLPE